MKKSKVYTGGGDKGKTGLVSGTRIDKSSERLDLYGEVDALNSQIGFLIAHLKEEEFFGNDTGYLQKIQDRLFDMGSLLACESEFHQQYKLNTFKSSDIEEIEHKIDFYDNQLIPLNSFILPGGHKAACIAHLCRTQCRKFERKMVGFSLKNPGEIADDLATFINRLSDFFFIFSRYINAKTGHEEIKWQKRS